MGKPALLDVLSKWKENGREEKAQAAYIIYEARDNKGSRYWHHVMAGHTENQKGFAPMFERWHEVSEALKLCDRVELRF